MILVRDKIYMLIEGGYHLPSKNYIYLHKKYIDI
jgi:hypothetical protein